MKMSQSVKNAVGNFLGYGRCPLTADTYWHADVVSVPYTESSGILVSARALSEVPAQEIAAKVYERSRNSPTTWRRYSLEEIQAQIPEECMHLPWEERR